MLQTSGIERHNAETCASGQKPTGTIAEPGNDTVDKKFTKLFAGDCYGVTGEIELPGKKIAAAWRCSTQEEKLEALKVMDSKLKILLMTREITSIRIE